MLDIKEIDKEIEKLENCDYITYSICQKLANMYIIKDHWERREVRTQAKRETSGLLTPAAEPEVNPIK